MSSIAVASLLRKAVTPESKGGAEVWMSLIYGSKGIVYFVHEWYPDFKEAGIFRHPEIVAEVNKTNNQIKELVRKQSFPLPELE